MDMKWSMKSKPSPLKGECRHCKHGKFQGDWVYMAVCGVQALVHRVKFGEVWASFDPWVQGVP